jgi:DNA-binding response OmpR family regulator
MATVLAVDDEADILDLIKVNLELDGHEVVTADSGDAALAWLRGAHADVILLDVMMPGTDGWTVLSQIKAEHDLDIANTPVLMLTARAGQDDRIRGGIEGAIRYLTKPFDPDALRAEVRDALAGAPEPVRRRQVQRESLEDLARVEKGGGGATVGAPRPRLTRLEHLPEAKTDRPAVLAARQRTGDLSPKQRELLRAIAASASVSAAADTLDVSRSNVYASLRRIGRKLGTRSVPELLDLVRSDQLDLEDA